MVFWDVGGGFYGVLTVPLSILMGMSILMGVGLALGKVVAAALAKKLLETWFSIP